MRNPPRSPQGQPRGQKKLRRGAAGFATVVVVLVVVGTMALTLFGAGVVSRALDVYDGNVWLWSSTNGSAARVNTSSGRVDMRYALKDAQGHDVAVIQTDNRLLLHDRTSGTVTSIDLTSLDTTKSVTVPVGASTSVSIWHDVVILADGPAGELRRLDPNNLSSKGEPLRLSPGLVTGDFDTDGHYWVASPKQGVAQAVTAASGSMKLRKNREATVADVNHNLQLSVLNHGAAIIDRTSGEVVVVGEDGNTRKVAAPDVRDGQVPARTAGSVIAIAVPKSRQVVLIEGGKVRTVTVPGSGELGQAAMFAGRLYVADDTAKQVLELTGSGPVSNRISTADSNGPVSIAQQEGSLLINEPRGDSGYVVNNHHEVKKFNKQAGGGRHSNTIVANEPQDNALKPATSLLGQGAGQTTKPGLLAPPARPGNSAAQPGAPQFTQPAGPPAVPPVQSSPVPTGVAAHIINGGRNIQVTWNAVQVPPGSKLDTYNVYACPASIGSAMGRCYSIVSSNTTSTIFTRGDGNELTTFTVSSVIDGKESAQSARSKPASFG
ncbi:MAG: hypothetical protein DLM55_05390 [Acidimicrobiales bacterium]|nr:MAG: hypothetical protein DLM55_05390 [Acidimicrobiales bacterium]